MLMNVKICMAAVAMLLLGSTVASAQPAGEITEVFFNPPDNETAREYFEVNISNYDSGYTYWFVALECEDGGNTDPGQVDLVVELKAVDGTGYYAYRPESCPTTSHVCGSGSFDGVYSEDQDLEGSGASYLLIAAKTCAITPGSVVSETGGTWDDDKNGTLDSEITSLINNDDWEILHAMACVAEPDDIEDAGTYLADYTFLPGNSGTMAFVAGTPVNTDDGEDYSFDEIEYVGRTGDGTPLEFAANLSDANHPSYSENCEFGVGGNESDENDCESGESVDQNGDQPYGFGEIITDTVGMANDASAPCP